MDRKQRTLVILSSLMCLVLVVSNIAAVKLWNLFGIPVDGGLIVFPISYVLGDAAVEIYGKKTANFLVWLVAALNVFTLAIFMAVIALPVYPGWDGQDALVSVLGSSVRITIGSLLAFVASSLSNNWLFVRVKAQQVVDHRYYPNVSIAAGLNRPENVSEQLLDEYDKGYRLRSIVSSMLGRLVDNLIFEIVGFYGVLPFNDFIKQAVGAYVEGMIAETLLVIFVSAPVIKLVKNYIRGEKSPA